MVRGGGREARKRVVGELDFFADRKINSTDHHHHHHHIKSTQGHLDHGDSRNEDDREPAPRDQALLVDH